MSETKQTTIAEALAAFHAECPAIVRDKRVTVTSRTGRSYTFDYAPLESILALVRPILAKHGLAIIQGQSFDGSNEYVDTTLLHDSGQTISSRIKVITRPDATAQEFGSSITYARRYGICLALCLAADDDDDAGEASGNETVTVKRGATQALASTETLRELVASPGYEEKRAVVLAHYQVVVADDLTEAQAREAITRLNSKKVPPTRKEPKP